MPLSIHAALARRITALEQNHDLLLLVLDPVLQLHQFGLQEGELFEIIVGGAVVRRGDAAVLRGGRRPTEGPGGGGSGPLVGTAAGEIINQIAKMQYMSSGRLKMPILLRGCIGIGHSAATHLLDAQHYPGSAGVVDSAMVRTRTRSS